MAWYRVPTRTLRVDLCDLCKGSRCMTTRLNQHTPLPGRAKGTEPHLALFARDGNKTRSKRRDFYIQRERSVRTDGNRAVWEMDWGACQPGSIVLLFGFTHGHSATSNKARTMLFWAPGYPHLPQKNNFCLLSVFGKCKAGILGIAPFSLWRSHIGRIQFNSKSKSKI